MLEKARRDNPKRRFALSDNRTALGVWIEKGGPYRTVAAIGIDDQWYAAGDVLANGKPVFTYSLARAESMTYPTETIERGLDRLAADVESAGVA